MSELYRTKSNYLHSLILSFGLEQTSTQKLSNYLETVFLSFLQSLEKFGLIMQALSVSLLSLDYVSHIKSAFAALSLSSETVLMEGVAAHEVD